MPRSRLRVPARCCTSPSQACHPSLTTVRACRSYVAAAYVKWVEQAGGRAVPIRCAGVNLLDRHAGHLAVALWLIKYLPHLQVLLLR